MQPSPDNEPHGLAAVTSLPHLLPLSSSPSPHSTPATLATLPCCSHCLMLFQVNTWLTSSSQSLWHTGCYEFTKTHFLFLVGTRLHYISQPPLQLGTNMWLKSGQWVGEMHASSTQAHKNFPTKLSLLSFILQLNGKKYEGHKEGSATR